MSWFKRVMTPIPERPELRADDVAIKEKDTPIKRFRETVDAKLAADKALSLSIHLGDRYDFRFSQRVPMSIDLSLRGDLAEGIEIVVSESGRTFGLSMFFWKPEHAVRVARWILETVKGEKIEPDLEASRRECDELRVKNLVAIKDRDRYVGWYQMCVARNKELEAEVDELTKQLKAKAT